MGIPMDDNIHTPSVLSGPATSQTNGFQDRSKASLNELFAEKDRLEEELKTLSDVLTSHGVTMSTSLTTFDGFPRNDIDVPQIRTTRARIIHLRNDYKHLMVNVEKTVHACFTELQQNPSTSETAIRPPAIEETSAPSELAETPFAKVNSVAPGSPADQAGLKTGDKIRNFGGVNWMNNENLRKLSPVVLQNQGRPLLVKVARPLPSGQDSNLNIRLIPRSDWGGRGMLGCHIVLL